jgi:hypothetical protein
LLKVKIVNFIKQTGEQFFYDKNEHHPVLRTPLLKDEGKVLNESIKRFRPDDCDQHKGGDKRARQAKERSELSDCGNFFKQF